MALLLAAAVALLPAGCRAPPLASPYPIARVVAVAPLANQSGSPDVDPLAVSDLFFSELQQVEGFQVLPINRSLQAMAALGIEQLANPVDALRLAEALGADIILAGAVTAYDPYDPPEVGLAVQLYIRPGPHAAGNPAAPRSQVNAIYNAADEKIQKKVRRFADLRSAGADPLGWRLYVKSIQHYVRFCCHEAIETLIVREQARIQVLPEQPRTRAHAD